MNLKLSCRVEGAINPFALRAVVSSFPMQICKQMISPFLILVGSLLPYYTNILCLVIEITVVNCSICIKMSSRELNTNRLDCFTITFEDFFSKEAKEHQEI